MQGDRNYIRERLAALDMVSGEQAADLLGISSADVELLVEARLCLALKNGITHDWRLPRWQFEQPLWSLMPQILAKLETSRWGALAWLETPLGGLGGVSPRTAVERGQGARVLQMAIPLLVKIRSRTA
ncbi:hypothetical protein [Roseateles toxinivorans]|uniref:Antitoxin Xre/MbcA/ParS-like toxin-binding domain-containing protein n=1 Tax=Roseateles toxinivorans TaxID=270368 RepID=A0A4R6QGS5_9BURK|nr:hypothetical protein [Roseateles toxinivorans]TDP61266.1 hypothetical protein DES47_11438 [Roseateles toxinivorans]